MKKSIEKLQRFRAFSASHYMANHFDRLIKTLSENSHSIRTIDHLEGMKDKFLRIKKSLFTL